MNVEKLQSSSGCIGRVIEKVSFVMFTSWGKGEKCKNNLLLTQPALRGIEMYNKEIESYFVQSVLSPGVVKGMGGTSISIFN